MGLRERIMGLPWVYSQFQRGLARPETSSWLVNEVVRAARGQKILDVGCGPAEILADLDDVSYVGIDHNIKYIRQARSKFGARGSFHCWDVTDPRLSQLERFDIVLVLGVLHHLTNEEVKVMLKSLSSILKGDGRLITFDCAIEVGQHPLARLLARLDRGRYARVTNEYEQLVSECFSITEVTVRHDLLRVPYTHAVITATPKLVT